MPIIPILQRHRRRSATCLGYTANARTTSVQRKKERLAYRKVYRLFWIKEKQIISHWQGSPCLQFPLLATWFLPIITTGDGLPSSQGPGSSPVPISTASPAISSPQPFITVDAICTSLFPCYSHTERPPQKSQALFWLFLSTLPRTVRNIQK